MYILYGRRTKAEATEKMEFCTCDFLASIVYPPAIVACFNCFRRVCSRIDTPKFKDDGTKEKNVGIEEWHTEEALHFLKPY